MRHRTRLLLTGLAAAATLAAAVSTASAAALEVSEGEFRATWARLIFDSDVTEPLSCEISLSGSFHSGTLSKTIGALIGAITSARGGDCEEGSVTVLTETLPWHLTYNGFTGRLPGIGGIRLLLVGIAWRFNQGGACLWITDVTEPAGLIANRNTTTGQLTSLTADESFAIDLDDPGFFCDFGGDARLTGSGSLLTPAGGLVFIRLITPPDDNDIEFTPAGEIELDSLHEITFTGGETRMTCNWTLTGRLTSGAILRTEGATVGTISSTSADHCSGGSIERVLSTPWNIKYMSATGTIPSAVTAVTLKVEGFSVNLRTFGANVGCLYGDDITGTLDLSGANSYPTGLWRLSEPRLDLVSGAGGCPASITATGTYWLGPEQALRFTE